MLFKDIKTSSDYASCGWRPANIVLSYYTFFVSSLCGFGRFKFKEYMGTVGVVLLHDAA